MKKRLWGYYYTACFTTDSFHTSVMEKAADHSFLVRCFYSFKISKIQALLKKSLQFRSCLNSAIRYFQIVFSLK